jgi:hypothetical protein
LKLLVDGDGERGTTLSNWEVLKKEFYSVP